MSLLLTLGLGTGAGAPIVTGGGTTPYMDLLLPTVSVTLGPLYAAEVNTAFQVVDSHNHTPGYGNLVPTAGLNINADLSFNGFNIQNLLNAFFDVQSPSTPGSIGKVYFSGQDLYVEDGAGNTIQMTASGAVNVSGLGSWTGLTSPAQAGYSSVSHTFSLQSNTTGPIYGYLNIGQLRIYPISSGTLPYIGIATPASGVTSYVLQLPPAVPATASTRQLMELNADGTCTLGPAPISGAVAFYTQNPTTGASQNVTLIDTGTMQTVPANGSGLIGVKTQGINTAQLATNAVTGPKMFPMNPISLTASGTLGYFGSAGSPTLISALGTSPTFVAQGNRPVVVNTNFGSVGSNGGDGSDAEANVSLYIRVHDSTAGTDFYIYAIQTQASASSGGAYSGTNLLYKNTLVTYCDAPLVAGHSYWFSVWYTNDFGGSTSFNIPAGFTVQLTEI